MLSSLLDICNPYKSQQIKTAKRNNRALTLIFDLIDYQAIILLWSLELELQIKITTVTYTKVNNKNKT